MMRFSPLLAIIQLQTAALVATLLLLFGGHVAIGAAVLATLVLPPQIFHCWFLERSRRLRENRTEAERYYR